MLLGGLLRLIGWNVQAYCANPLIAGYTSHQIAVTAGLLLYAVGLLARGTGRLRLRVLAIGGLVYCREGASLPQK